MVLPGKGISWKTFLRDLKQEWSNDALTDMAGSVTFFAILAIFPFLLFLVSLASLFINPSDAEGLIDQLGQIAPQAVTQILGDRLRALATQKSVGLLTVSAIAAVWSASGGIASLMTALNTCYGVKDTRPLWKSRGLAVLMTFFAALFTILATLAAVALPPIANSIGGPIAVGLLWLRMPVAVVLMMFLWAVMYYVLPDVEQRFRFITPGSVVGVVLWAVASYGFSQYVAHFANYEVVYGTLGGVVIMLFWMWLSALALLLGAEINAIIEHRSPEGKRVGVKSMADTGADLPKSEKAEIEGKKRSVIVRPMSVREAVTRSAKNSASTFLLGLVFRTLRRRSG
jgi:membrane protein